MNHHRITTTARAPRAVDRESTPPSGRRRIVRVPRGVVGQVRAAFAPGARLATAIGAVLGGFVPISTWQVTHHELSAAAPLWQQPLTLLVLGGLLYSATTVFAWGKLAFRSPVKAAGFVVLLEGVLVGSQTPWLSAAALVVLAGVNAIATGATLSSEAAS